LAAAIKNELDIESTLIKGDRGIFDVKADGATVFSKHDEILRALRARGA
jgi:hypothetical protein